MMCETGISDMASVVPGKSHFLSMRKVLVAEDQEDVVAALRLLLKNSGYDAEFVKSPGEALDALRNHSFDAALLDLNYSRDTTSGSEGLELISQVQAIDDTLAVVVMTAWGSIGLAVDAMHRGACDFVQKPWDNRQLLEVLERQMERSQAIRRRRLSELLEQQEAAQIQRALMPGEIAAPEGLSIVASSQSARSVGGDYYDVIRLDEYRCAVCIADAVGKGMGAALLMSNLQAAVHALAPEIGQPKAMCERLNRIVSAYSMPGKFISFFYCVIDSREKTIQYTNAGHNWPILACADGSFRRLSSDDVVLGAVRDWSFHQQQAGLSTGDRLVLFTDGITECADSAAVEFGEDRLAALVQNNIQFSALQLRDLVLEATRQHCNADSVDDATLIVAAVH
jgi:phosphoserine phosphatase RsbU/P